MKMNETNQELKFTVEYQDPEVIVRSEGIELHYYRALRRRSPWVRRGYGIVRGYNFDSEKVSGICRWKKSGRGKMKATYEVWDMLDQADTFLAQQGFGFL